MNVLDSNIWCSASFFTCFSWYGRFFCFHIKQHTHDIKGWQRKIWVNCCCKYFIFIFWLRYSRKFIYLFFFNKKDSSIVFPVCPLLLFLCMSFSIANKSEKIFLLHTCLFILTFGIVWAKFTVELIVNKIFFKIKVNFLLILGLIILRVYIIIKIIIIF